MNCTGCASELTTGPLCGVCLEAGWEQRDCGCIYDPQEERVTECADCTNDRADAGDGYFSGSSGADAAELRQRMDDAYEQKYAWRREYR